jgi:hypothetical protein
MGNDVQLIAKLDEFIRKYYKNRIIRGLLVVLAVVASLFLVSVFLEYLFKFGILLRSVLFFMNISMALFFLVRLVVVPSLQYLRIGKTLSHEQAAEIIGNHFSDIRDKLLNTLQLISLSRQTGENKELLIAGIDQKISGLKIFRFPTAVNIRSNLKYLRYAIPPVLLIMVLAILSPSFIAEPASRIIHYTERHAIRLPFEVEILNKNLKALQQDDFRLEIKFTGEEIPGESFLLIEGIRLKMTREKSFLYSYQWKSLQGDIRFRIVAGQYQSEDYMLKVYPKPILLNFDALLEYPGYIGKASELLENSGDLVVPEGTKVTWNLYTRDVTAVVMNFPDSRHMLLKGDRNKFSWSGIQKESFSYSIVPYNEYVYKPDSLVYLLTVIKDGFPLVDVNEAHDSSMVTSVFFKCAVKDDYGFSRLEFKYFRKAAGDTAGLLEAVLIPVSTETNSQVVHFTKDFSDVTLNPGDEISYYFEVWDNDGINGPKSARSEIRVIKTPALDELEQSMEKNEERIRKDLEGTLKESESVNRSIDQLNRKMVEQKSMSWQEKKQLEEIIKSNEKIKEKIREIKERNEENIRNEEKYLETSERIVEKQKKLNELMEQLLTDEMKKMMQELKDLLNEVDKQKLGEALEKLKLSNEDLEKQLDRNLQLYKQIEFERKLEKTIDELRKAAEEQEKLAGETETNKEPSEEIAPKQQELNNRFDTLRKELESLKNDAQKLEDPPDLESTREKQERIGEQLKNSLDEIKKKNPKGASKSQKEAAKEMKELAQDLESMQEEAEEEQLEEDAGNLRMILENLLRLSFEQEELIYRTSTFNRMDPRFLEIITKQKEIKERLLVLEDSIQAVARRQVEIKPVVTREIASINENIMMTIDALDARNVSVAASRQQYTMTAVNNLALLLSEALNQMNQEMNMSMSGKGSKSCKKPSSKGGGKKVKNMKDLQRKLGEQVNQTKAGLEKMKKEGQGSKPDKNAMNQQIARMAAQQEAIRNELKKYQEGLNEKGIKDGGNLSKMLNEMEEAEKDILNKRITRETIDRQERIMTRMLESEKAEEMREQEEKRESVEAKSKKISNPDEEFEYKRKRSQGNEMLKLQDPRLNFFYRTKANEYMSKIRK